MDDNRKDTEALIHFYIMLVIVLALGLGLFALVLNIRTNYRSTEHFLRHMSIRLSHPGLSNDLDSARQELKDTFETAKLYEIKSGDYVESVSAAITYDDLHYGESDWSNIEKIEVTIMMQEEFNELPIQDRCQTLVTIREEITQSADDLYCSSNYYQLFDKYKYDFGDPFRDYIDYRGLELHIRHEYRFTFYDKACEYDLKNYELTVVLSDSIKRIYVFYVVNGQITEFKDLYKEGLIDSHGNIIYSYSNSSGSSSGTSSGKKDTTTNGSGSSYDPYDVHDYNSADDFADDKYEEFYDYEDEYEDQDEAYDAAEDYWYDEY